LNKIENIFNTKLRFIHQDKIRQLYNNFTNYQKINDFIFDTEIANDILDKVNCNIVDLSQHQIIHIPETLNRVINFKNTIIEIEDICGVNVDELTEFLNNLQQSDGLIILHIYRYYTKQMTYVTIEFGSLTK
jgi:hypothetical protein